jgi:hypothetical protein
MPRAFVLLNVETGSEDNVLKQLKNISNVEQAYISYGVYELIIWLGRKHGRTKGSCDRKDSPT